MQIIDDFGYLLPSTLAGSLDFQGTDPNYELQSNVENSIILVPHQEEISGEIELQHRYLGISDLVSNRKSQSTLTEGRVESDDLVIKEVDEDTNVSSACDESLQHMYLVTRDLQKQPKQRKSGICRPVKQCTRYN